MNEDRKDLIRRIIVVVLMIAVAVGMGLILHSYGGRKEEPKVLTTEQAKDAETVAKEVKVSYPEAQTIVREIERSSGSTPQITYYVTAPTVEGATKGTAEAIRTNSPALPAEVTKKTDRTIVTADTDRQKVDVYKITLRKAHKIKTGMTYIDNRAYITAGYQAGRWEGLAHFDGNGFQGATVMYTLKEW